MNINRILFLLYSFFTLQSLIIQIKADFIYIVDTLLDENNQTKLAVMHQKTNQKLKNGSLQLLLCDPDTFETEQGLLSFYNPAGLRVLPSKKAFSFVDNDRLRIKKREIRSPKSIDFFGPYDIALIEWISDDLFIFSAKEHQSDNIFVGTIDGDLCRLTKSNKYDYMYPSKIEGELFYIKKDSNNNFHVGKIPFPKDSISAYFDELNNDATIETTIKSISLYDKTYVSEWKEQDETLLFSTEEHSLAFLKMVSPEKGFFLSHQLYIETSLEYISCTYHMLFKETDTWQTKALFSFNIPLKLLLKRDYKMRLYESILPLLPYYDGDQNILYYSHYDQQSDTMNVYRYLITKEISEQKTFVSQKGSLCFCPRIYKNTIFCGGLVKEDNKEGPLMKDSEDNFTLEFISFLK